MNDLEWWEKKYAEAVDEAHPDGVTIEGMSLVASRILREVDPIAFRCNANDYADAMGFDTDKAEDEQESDDE